MLRGWGLLHDATPYRLEGLDAEHQVFLDWLITNPFMPDAERQGTLSQVDETDDERHPPQLCEDVDDVDVDEDE